MLSLSARKIIDEFGVSPKWDAAVKHYKYFTLPSLLEKITEGDSRAFVQKKSKVGFSIWSFDEVVLYKGYKGALQIVERYRRIPAYRMCRLVASYYHTMGDGYLIKGFLYDKKIEIITDKKGIIISKEGLGQSFRDFEKSIKDFKKESHIGIFQAEHKDSIKTKISKEGAALIEDVLSSIMLNFDD